MEQENNRLLPVPTERLNVWAISQPFSTARAHFDFPEGLSVKQILDLVAPKSSLPQEARVFIGDELVLPQYYHAVYPKAHALINIRMVPQGGGGGKNPLRVLLTIAVFAVASWAAAAYAASLAAAVTGVVGPATALQMGIASALIKVGVGAVGSLLVNAIAPPASQKMNGLSSSTGSQSRDSPTMFIQGARNSLTPFGVIPIVLGKHRLVPPQCANPYTETVGDDQYVRQLFCWGYGDIELTNLKIGDTLLSSFEDVEVEHILDGDSTSPIGLYPDSVNQEGLNILLSSASSWQLRTTSLEAEEVHVDLTFPQGLSRFDDTGKRLSATVSYEIRYKLVSSGTWTTESFTLTLAKTSAVRKAHRFVVPKGQYDVEVRRVTTDSTSSQVMDTVYWTALKTVTTGSPVRMGGLCLTALRMRATDQLNGAVDQLSGEVAPKILDWNGTAWVKRATLNPASIYRYILQGPANARPKSDSEISLETLQEWHEYCTSKGLEYGGVIDYSTSVDAVLREVTASGRASPTLLDGRESVVIDRVQTLPVQHVTPRNSWGYEYEKGFPDIPHAFIVEFTNRDKDYIRDERFVYDDGYDESNATDFERLELPGITSSSLAWKHAREHIATLRLRPDTHTFHMDVENLVATRGDLIYFSHDIPLVGLGWGRIKQVIDDGSGNAIAVIVDEELTMVAGPSYSIRYRKKDGSSIVKVVNTEIGDSITYLAFNTPFPLAGAPEPGDLFMFGETGKEKLELIIKEIIPGADFTAQLVCQNAAPEIFDASTGSIPDYDSGMTLPPEFSRPVAPEVVSIQTGEEAQVRNLDGSISSRMVVNLKNNNSTPVLPVAKVRLLGETEFQPARVIYSSDSQLVIEGLQEKAIYDLKLFYKKTSSSVVSSSLLSPALQVNGITFQGTSGVPSDVTGFTATVRGTTLYLSWDRGTEIDLDHYEIRYSTDVSTPSWDSAIPISPREVPAASNSLTLPAVVGSYLIRAVDRSDNYSANATIITPGIAMVNGLNFVDVIDEAPTWPGTKTHATVVSGTLKLDSAYTDGSYLFDTTFDLGAVYTSVITAILDVAGENLLSTVDAWTSIDALSSIDGSESSQYRVSLEIRTTNDDPGASPTWSEWTPLVVGDYTARAFQFRLILVSLESGVIPTVLSAQIQIDMPDRVASGTGLLVTTSGLSVSFDPPFKVTPALGFAHEDMATGDYYEVTNLDKDGFDIIFKNATGLPIARTFSYVAKGYGYEN